MIVISNDLFNKRNTAKDDDVLTQLLAGRGISDFTIVFISDNPERHAKRLVPEVVEKGNIIYECSKGRRNQDKLSPKMMRDIIDQYNSESYIVIFKDFIDSVNVYDRADCRFQTLMHDLRERRCTCLVNYSVERFRGITDKNINWSYRKGKSGIAKDFHKALRNPENSYIINLERAGHFKGYDPRCFANNNCPKVREEYEQYKLRISDSIEALKSYVETLRPNFSIFSLDHAYERDKGIVHINKGHKTVGEYLRESRRSKAEGWIDPKTDQFKLNKEGNMIIPEAFFYGARSREDFDRNNIMKLRGKNMEYFAFEYDGVTPRDFLKYTIAGLNNFISWDSIFEQDEVGGHVGVFSGYKEKLRAMKVCYDGFRNRYYKKGKELGYEFQALGDIYCEAGMLGLSFRDITTMLIDVYYPDLHNELQEDAFKQFFQSNTIEKEKQEETN